MFDVVCLSSGGLDSTVCLKLLQRQGLRVLPVFVNYGQRNLDFELESLRYNCTQHQFHPPEVFDLSSIGRNIPTGLTSVEHHVVEDAFTPNRNLIFLTVAASVAYHRGCTSVALGFLSESTAIFPDQTDAFLDGAQRLLSLSLGADIRIITPLRDLAKRDVLQVAREIGVNSYYSCHGGGTPCGKCIACLEYGEELWAAAEAATTHP